MQEKREEDHMIKIFRTFKNQKGWKKSFQNVIKYSLAINSHLNT